MYEVYRVRQPFRWRGWHYGPQHLTGSTNPETGQMERCDCPHYAGDIILIEAGHPRKDIMVGLLKHIRGDASLPSVDELLKEEKFRRLLSPPDEQPARELVGAGQAKRGPGRPAAPR